ncbi:MAG: LytR C-terminal domain-containing protein [Nocardioidaceae bacterium]|nr:LytR C-terminal domain-containing protein [Nocardioidaceae bacterium]NUS52566.1 LytR C-terminal domain-containing protein [Nocardioidaceae bacterium]
MGPFPARRLDQRGVALSSPMALLSVAAVVLAGAAYVATNRTDTPEKTAAPVVKHSATPTPTTPSPTPVVRATPTHKPKPKPKPKAPAVKRGSVYVEVYNNSGVKGLAGRTAGRAQGAGWQVVGSDNWYGTISASTVYYPARLHAAAKLLAKDLGISRLKPAIAPMRFDRLTVILTSDYS